MKNQRVAVVAVLIVICLSSAVAYAKKGKSKPIKLSFVQKPARKITQAETYTLEVSWKNNDKAHSYEGCFIFTLHAYFQIERSDLNFIFEGATIPPLVADDSLMYILPVQTFNAAETGTIKAEVTYNKPGTFRWRIDTARMAEIR